MCDSALLPSYYFAIGVRTRLRFFIRILYRLLCLMLVVVLFQYDLEVHLALMVLEKIVLIKWSESVKARLITKKKKKLLKQRLKTIRRQNKHSKNMSC